MGKIKIIPVDKGIILSILTYQGNVTVSLSVEEGMFLARDLLSTFLPQIIKSEDFKEGFEFFLSKMPPLLSRKIAKIARMITDDL